MATPTRTPGVSQESVLRGLLSDALQVICDLAVHVDADVLERVLRDGKFLQKVREAVKP